MGRVFRAVGVVVDSGESARRVRLSWAVDDHVVLKRVWSGIGGEREGGVGKRGFVERFGVWEWQ